MLPALIPAATTAARFLPAAARNLAQNPNVQALGRSAAESAAQEGGSRVGQFAAAEGVASLQAMFNKESNNGYMDFTSDTPPQA